MIGLSKEFFVSGGTMPLDSESYIERSADGELLDHLAARRYCYVLNSRQMGKSSLSVRTIARLRERGVRTVFIDLTQIGGRNVQANQWYAGLTGEVGRGLGLTTKVLEYYKTHTELSPMQRFFGAIREVILEKVEGPVVVFVDEIDTTRNLPFDTDEFFAGIRECYNRRVQDDRCRRLTFCLIGVAVPNDLIRNPSTTPFNIGERIRLSDFSLAEISSFAKALGPNGRHLAERVHYWTNGQPFLTQSLCHEIEADPKIQDEHHVDELVQRMFFGPKALDTNLNLADVANRILSDPEHTGDTDKYRADLLSAYERARKGGFVKDDEANRISVVLKLSGLLYPKGARLIVRNRIYHHVFDRGWIEANMPGQELIRQKQSFRRGLIRGFAVTAVLGSLIGALALFALKARHEALEARSQLDYDLYVSDMGGMRLYEDQGDAAKMAAILARQKGDSHRGFEWNYWLARLHDSPEEYTLDYSAPAKDELGYLSYDGKQVCVLDRLARTEVVVDRATKRVIGSAIPSEAIVATSNGFRQFSRGNCPTPVNDVLTGRKLFTIGRPGFRLGGDLTLPQSNFAIVDLEVMAHPETSRIELWDIAAGKNLSTYRTVDHILGVVGAAEDGSRFAIQGEPKVRTSVRQFVRICDTKSGTTVDEFPIQRYPLFDLLSPSGRLFAYLDEHRRVLIRDVDRHKVIYESPLSDGEAPLSVNVSKDDKQMIWITPDGHASIREIASGNQIAVRTMIRSVTPTKEANIWVGNSASVRLMDLSPKGCGLVGSGEKLRRDGLGAIRVTVEGNSTIERLSDPSLDRLSDIVAPKSARNLTYNGLWAITGEAAPNEAIAPLGTNWKAIHVPYHIENFSCGVQPDLVTILGGFDWQGIDGRTGKVLWKYRDTHFFRGVWMTPDDQSLVATTWTGYACKVDPKTGKVLRQSGAHKLQVTSLSFSHDSKYFVTGGGDGKAILWRTDTLDKLQEFRGDAAQQIDGADVSPDGKRVVTCNVTGAWQIWDVATGQQLTEVRASYLPLRSVLFSSDGQKVITSGDDGVVREWPSLQKDPTVRVPVPKDTLTNVEFDR